jgi:hypothetical protein
MRHRLAALYETGMHPHCPAVPWMPRIADFTDVSNMGVVLLSCTTKRETTKVRTTFCSSPPLLRLNPVGDLESIVENASADYFATTAAPHEYFDQTGSVIPLVESYQ